MTGVREWDDEVDAFVPIELEPDPLDAAIAAAGRASIVRNKVSNRPPRTPVEAALGYGGRGWKVFSCHWKGERRKRPLVADWPNAASTDPDQITTSWARWPEALIGTPTGHGFIVLDVDNKNGVCGYDSLEELGHSILPDTWLAHTASGGLHIYFGSSDAEIRNSAGKLGPGLDIRGAGGFVIIPSPGSGYSWDPHWNPDSAPLAPVPAWLIEALTETPQLDQSPRPIVRLSLSRYGETALDNAVDRIVHAPDGQQRQTLNREVFAIAGLVAGGVIPSPLALEALHWAAGQMPSHDSRRPWRPNELQKIVRAAFLDGLAHPRQPGRTA